jgi:hypothetical protein
VKPKAVELSCTESVGFLLTLRNRQGDSAVSAELQALGRLQRDLGVQYDQKLDHILSAILKLTERKEVFVTETAELTRLKECLGSLEEESKLRRQQLRIIRSLYFPELRRRWQQIPEADVTTNAWLFDRTKTKFLDWLESGSGIFWITGKVRFRLALPSRGRNTMLLIVHVSGGQWKIDPDKIRIRTPRNKASSEAVGPALGAIPS